MGSQCSALWRGKIEEKEPDQKIDEVSTTGKSREKSPLLQRKLSLQEEGGNVEETPVDEILRR